MILICCQKLFSKIKKKPLKEKDQEAKCENIGKVRLRAG